jgi:hypothetical protein
MTNTQLNQLNAAVTNKLTEKQVTRFTKRFVYKSDDRSFLNQPFRTANYIVATDSHTMLFIPKDLSEIVIDNEAMDDIDKRSSSVCERILNNFNPSTVLEIDSIQITSIIKSLKDVQRQLKTKRTLTTIEYNNKLNEITLTTEPIELNELLEEGTVSNHLYYRPSSILPNHTNSAVATVNTNYLISTLMTQKESAGYTTIEINNNERNMVKFHNKTTTAIVLQIRR